MFPPGYTCCCGERCFFLRRVGCNDEPGLIAYRITSDSTTLHALAASGANFYAKIKPATFDDPTDYTVHAGGYVVLEPEATAPTKFACWHVQYGDDCDRDVGDEMTWLEWDLTQADPPVEGQYLPGNIASATVIYSPTIYPRPDDFLCTDEWYILSLCPCCEGDANDPAISACASPDRQQRVYNRITSTEDNYAYLMRWWNPDVPEWVTVTVTVDNPGGAGPDSTVDLIAQKCADAWNAEAGILDPITAEVGFNGVVSWVMGGGGGVSSAYPLFIVSNFTVGPQYWEFGHAPALSDHVTSLDYTHYPDFTKTAFEDAVAVGDGMQWQFTTDFGGFTLEPFGGDSLDEPEGFDDDNLDTFLDDASCWTVTEATEPEDNTHHRHFIHRTHARIDATSPGDPALDYIYKGNGDIATVEYLGNIVGCDDIDGEPCSDYNGPYCPVVCDGVCYSANSTIAMHMTFDLTVNDGADPPVVSYETQGVDIEWPMFAPGIGPCDEAVGCTGDEVNNGSGPVRPACGPCEDMIASPIASYYGVQFSGCSTIFGLSIQTRSNAVCPGLTLNQLVNIAFEVTPIDNESGSCTVDSITFSDSTWSASAGTFVVAVSCVSANAFYQITSPVDWEMVGGKCVPIEEEAP